MNCGSAFEPGLPGFPITAPPPGCAPDVIGAPAVWRLKKKKLEGYLCGGINPQPADAR